MKFPDKLILANGHKVQRAEQLFHLYQNPQPGKEELLSSLEAFGLKAFALNEEVSKQTHSFRRINRSAQSIFVQADDTKALEGSWEKLSSQLSEFGALLSPVYFSDRKELNSYFAVKADILIVQPSRSMKELNASMKKNGLLRDDIRSQYLSGKAVYRISEGLELDQIARLRRYATVQEVYFEKIPLLAPTLSTPNDPYFGQAWHLSKIQWSEDLAACSGSPVIAVIDEGVELQHPDLSLASPGLRLSTMTPDGSPTGNHGTACAGIAGALLNNATGVTGVAGKAKVLPLAVVTWSDLEIANGLNYAVQFGADVISMSFGVYDSWNYWNYDLIDPEILFAANQGTFMCAATGNENSANLMRYPSKHPLVLSVGGSNKDDKRKSIGDTSAESWWGACYGEEIYKNSVVGVNVVAPCLQIPTTDRLGAAGYSSTDYYGAFNGTSSATPIVAGLAALIKSRYPEAGNSLVKRIIEQSADKVAPYLYSLRPEFPNAAWNPEMGHGRVNARKALKLAKEILGDDCCCCGDSAESKSLIAFSAVGQKHISKGKPQMLQNFAKIILNEGDCFQKDRLLAPEAGIYALDWSFCKDSFYHNGTADDVHVFVEHNGKRIPGDAISGQGAGKRGTGSSNIILRLEKGDEVRLMAVSDGGFQRHIYHYVFSGHRI